MILLSIIIPVFNVEEYLSKCLDSILLQNVNGCEIILVNDGSTDSSPMICDQYARKYSCVKILHSKNEGVSAARNKGIKLAEGRYIWFIDSDDYIANFLSCVLNQLLAYKLDVLLINPVFVDRFGTKICNIKTPYKKLSSVVKSGSYYIEYILRSYYVWLFIFRKEYFVDKYFNSRLKICEDLDLIPFILLEANRVKLLSEPILYFYVQRSGSALHSYNDVYMDNLLDILYRYNKMINSDIKFEVLFDIKLSLVRNILFFLSDKFYSKRINEVLSVFQVLSIKKVYRDDTYLHKLQNFCFKYCPKLMIKSANWYFSIRKLFGMS